MKTMHYAGSPGKGYGWGVFNSNMYRELDKHFVMVTSNHDPVDVCFMPVDGAFRPISTARGKVNVCMNFFEFPMEECAAENAAKFDVCFVGSTWCQQRCAEAGIHNTRVLIQGVDGDIFKPQPTRQPDNSIRIFSGGKFEYRKGQDLVIAAFREFLKSHPTAHLICAWHNPWPQLLGTINASKVIRIPAISGTQDEIFSCLLTENGIPHESFTILPQLTQQGLADEMARTDFGVFPNRCEGGNNLVMQEYMALDRSVVANCGTGHRDVMGAIAQHIDFTEDAQHWAVQTVPDIVSAMGRAMLFLGTDRNSSQRAMPSTWTWEAAVRTVLDAIS